jgi:hypothetical protein
MSARSTAAAIAAILTFALLTTWVPARWPVYLAEGMAFAMAALWMALRIVRPGTVRIRRVRMAAE